MCAQLLDEPTAPGRRARQWSAARRPCHAAHGTCDRYNSLVGRHVYVKHVVQDRAVTPLRCLLAALAISSAIRATCGCHDVQCGTAARRRSRLRSGVGSFHIRRASVLDDPRRQSTSRASFQMIRRLQFRRCSHRQGKSADRNESKSQVRTKAATLASHNDLHAIGFEFMADNQYIRRGYRVHYSAADCLRSLFALHNETWNVWIHIVGSLLFAAMATLPMDDVAAAHHGSEALATWPIRVYLSCVAVCFALSAIYHLMFVQSREWSAIFLQFDFAGILVLLFGTSVPKLYYTFYCDPIFQQLYLVMAAMVGGGGIVATFTPSFRSHRHHRVLVYASSIAAMCVVPLAHLLTTVGPSDPQVKMMLQPMAMGLVFNLPGIFFYTTRFPERLAPGTFDIWGSSHQLWHLCVLFVGFAYFGQVNAQFESRLAAMCPFDQLQF
ncbi:hypothetical protein H310_08782 [Aphanomyces invadans]|uniref:Uncharacterized protein n=1 Tax=Aphanomyces invadans TaxID=157072 RepID=A0A024TXG5_9STRA|nr:hypothetical protein H310_08782 [Aphanomyces invadans]ETV98679.1 hypothetical protein H310_08782 [Aphanomyces invadans]|eukprot:XP_008872876.1 hypothetical protein H310_08782 [Aphanomyces invadans]